MNALALPRLRSDQWAIASHPAKVKVLAMGRRWGKTVLGGSVSLAAASQGAKVAWVVPTYRNGRPLWQWADNAVAMLRKAGKVTTNKSERLIEFIYGGFLGIYSADSPDSIRGDWFHLVIIDEAARVVEEAWTDVIQPTLADVDGDAILISTPKGRNWFWREWNRGLADGQRVASFAAPSSANPNPKIREAARLAQDRVTNRTYRQEWLAEFLEGEGTVFRNLAACMSAPKDARPDDHKKHRLVAGLDWAKQNDFTATSIVCADCKVEVAHDRFNQIDYHFQRDRLKALYNKWDVSHIEGESNSIGEPNIEELQRDGLPIVGFQTTATSKPPLIESLALCFEKVECQWLDNPIWTGEAEAYEITTSPITGRATYSAPAGWHDDTVMARALAWRGIVAAPGWLSFARRQMEKSKDGKH